MKQAKLSCAHFNLIRVSRYAIYLLAFTAILIHPARAVADGKESEEKKNPYLWQPRVKTVAVFKNGLGFFMREGDVKLRDGWCLAGQVPPALFGTLAIFSHKAGEVVDIVGAGKGDIIEFDGRDAKNDVATKLARLEASLYCMVTLDYKQQGAAKSASGKLVSVSKEFAILENTNNSFAVPVEGVTKLQVLELPLRAHVVTEKGKSPADSTLGMAYLQKGITWVPEYTLRILDKDTAELTLRGTLVNEAEDLIHCDVNFVVGAPHFVHTDFLTPVAVGQVIRTIGASVAPPQVMTQMMNRAAFANDLRAPEAPAVIEQPVSGPGDLKHALGNLPELGGPASSDYTVYRKQDLTVRRGEKAIVTLFVHKIKYGHVYRWNTNQGLTHHLVLRNATPTAWTTGPCLGLEGDKPLTEDLLYYTPKEGSAELPVTAAVNIACGQNESETDRKLKAYSPNNNINFLDLVTLQGKLTLKNFEKETLDVIIAAPIPGKPLSASDAGVISIDPSKLQLLQRQGTITWRLKLEPDETKTLTFQYERYVPSQ